MKNMYPSLRQIRQMPILLAFILLSICSHVFSQSYNGNTWYSLYDGTEYYKSTSDAGIIHTYNNVFLPHTGSFSFESKLPGNGNYETEYAPAHPHLTEDLEKGYCHVQDYQVDFGNVTGIDVEQHIWLSSSSESYKSPFLTMYRILYTFTYNYRAVTQEGLNPNLTSIDVNYRYSEYNTDRTVYIKEVKVPLAKHIRLYDPNNSLGTTAVSHNFGETYIGHNSEAYEVNFRSFLTSKNTDCGNISISLTSGDPEVFRLGTTDNITGTIETSTYGNSYNVGQNACASANGSDEACSSGRLGNIDNYGFRVYFHPKAETSYSGTITITDGENTATVTLSGSSIPMAFGANEDPANPGVYYSSFYDSEMQYELPAGTEAFAAVISGDVLNLTKIADAGEVIPKGAAVILRSDNTSITLEPSEEEPVTVTANDLRGVDVLTDIADLITGTCYVLSGGSEGVGFYRYQAPNQLKAHKAFLDMPDGASMTPKRLRFVFNNENTATSIENIQSYQVQTTKELHDGQLVIILGNKEFNAQGQMIK